MGTSQFATKDLDHLGLVAGMCHHIGLIERIDELVPDMGGDVSVGQATQAMVLNGLGFVGRALDQLYDAGVTEAFAHVSAHALSEMGIETSTIHLAAPVLGCMGRKSSRRVSRPR